MLVISTPLAITAEANKKMIFMTVVFDCKDEDHRYGKIERIGHFWDTSDFITAACSDTYRKAGCYLNSAEEGVSKRFSIVHAYKNAREYDFSSAGIRLV